MDQNPPAHRPYGHSAYRAQQRNALGLGERLRGTTFTKVYFSPLQRSRRTAELAGFGSLGEVEPDLLEWDYGEYDGLRTDEIRQHGLTGRCFATAALAARRSPKLAPGPIAWRPGCGRWAAGSCSLATRISSACSPPAGSNYRQRREASSSLARRRSVSWVTNIPRANHPFVSGTMTVT